MFGQLLCHNVYFFLLILKISKIIKLIKCKSYIIVFYNYGYLSSS